MSDDIGRISGPLLSENLLRQGIDLAFETSLLYLNVSTKIIGVNTDAPVKPLTVSGTTNTTNLIVNTLTDTPNYSISLSTIQNLLGTIYIQPDQTTNPVITTTRIGNDNIRISNQLIENYITNSDIQILPSGSGIVHFTTNRVDVYGNLHATGNITWDGDVTIGDGNTDNVVFNADINSNLIPNIDNLYNVGSASQEWATLYSYNIKSNYIESDTFTVNDIDLLTTPGNTLYVSVNGSDTNYGDHQHSTFRTVKHALSQASSGDQIVIFPGTYTEEFPLTVPQGVSIRGTSIRSVSIQPTSGTNTNDAFLLNGDTTVEFLTIQNFYNGYAFKFANNFKTLNRSPYIYNVSVITKGSVTSLSDPLGYNQTDAGGGAYIDGSVADPTGTIPPTMLFFSATFIVPNANGIVGTNGVRIEWLNSFTYYAKRGIYLLNGTLGRSSLGTTFGAEMRSINSASVYGEFGAIANGSSTIGYLIGHNFGYIGSGANSSNDPRLVIQANEVFEENSGTIYFESVDHKGDVRIGDIFYVKQETGSVIFDAQSLNFGPTGSIVLESPSSSTIINSQFVQTGNIRIYDNHVDSLTGPVNFKAASGKIYLNTDVFVTGNTSITDDVKVSGNVYLGDTPYDLITVFPNLTQHINPDETNKWTLGTDTERWNTLFGTLLDVDGVVQITNNTVSTLTTDTDLKLIAAGTGRIYVSSTDAQIDNDLTVNNVLTINGDTSLQNVELFGDITHIGDYHQTGDYNLIGTFANHNIIIDGDSYFEVPTVRLYDNVISERATDSDIQFFANGTGGVVLDSKLKLTDNNIQNFWTGATTNLQKSVILTPNGTGNLELNSTKSLILPIGNNTNRVFSQVGEVRYNDISNMVEGWAPSGYVNFMNLWDSDRNTYITAELTPNANDNTLRFSINGTVKATITPTALSTNNIYVDNINIISNNISNLVGANDVNLVPSGTGYINVNDVWLKDNNITNTLDTALTLASTGVGYIKFTGTGGVVFAIGTNAERRDFPELGETRYNTDLGYMEVFNGTEWLAATGASGNISADDAEDIMDIWTLILG